MVEHRLAKARVAGSSPVSRSSRLPSEQAIRRALESSRPPSLAPEVFFRAAGLSPAHGRRIGFARNPGKSMNSGAAGKEKNSIFAPEVSRHGLKVAVGTRGLIRPGGTIVQDGAVPKR